MTKSEINIINTNEVEIDKLTPVMKQYMEIKLQNPDIVLLYRLGDFYETFFEDALLLSKELEITLTGKDAGSYYGRIPLAGIPAKAVRGYLEKLVYKNLKVAVCEQLEDPKDAKGLVKRGVVRVITAGTLTESDFLNQDTNNYICATFKDEKTQNYGFAYADISTGEFRVTQAPLELIKSELARVNPVEVIAPALPQKIQPFQIVPEEKINLPEEIQQSYNCSKVPSKVFDLSFAENNLKALFEPSKLDAFGFSEYKLGFRAAGALIGYVWENLKDSVPKFEKIVPYELSEYLMMDSNTMKNLELVQTMRDKSRYGTLLWAIDKTKTNMGARLLKNWICQPLKDLKSILARQNSISEFVQKQDVRINLIEKLEKIYDIQRLSTRLSNNSASPKDFLSLKDSLKILPELTDIAQNLEFNPFKKITSYLDEIVDFAEIIDKTIDEEAPMLIKDGGVIKAGVSGELDYFRELLTGGESWLKQFEEREKEKTGIKTLRVSYNKVFGFYIEISKSYIDEVPSNYIRRQTLTNGERYITDELKKHEDDVLSAKFKSSELEYKLFCDFREYSKEFVTKIREIAECVANADVLSSLAQVAVENNYSCPIVDESDDFIVKNGRHPVLEKVLPFGQYVPNDLELKSNSTDGTQFMILTGPNMAGKSTYMRQNALIVLLSQIGSWVPADYVKLGVADKIFTRVGASDDLTLGQSTFMVEMVETSHILNSATERSFILLDEIGRGTSTYDGVAIAWSVAEYIATKINARCIFATHYHELNVMTKTYPQIKNYRITVSEENGEIEFLRKIVQGGASRSYGIQVAKMAGLPNEVLARSQALMTKMQKNYSNDLSSRKKSNEIEPQVPQLNLFD